MEGSCDLLSGFNFGILKHVIFRFAPWVNHAHSFITWLSTNRLKWLHHLGIRLSTSKIAEELGDVGQRKKIDVGLDEHEPPTNKFFESKGISKSPLLEGYHHGFC